MKVRRTTRSSKVSVQADKTKPFEALPVTSTVKTRSVYTLIDPSTGLSFYVGLSEEPYERFIAHLQCRDNNDAKNARILNLKRRNLVPIMEVLHTSRASLERHHKIEAYYIDLFRVYRQPLTNQTLMIGYTLDEYEMSLIDEVHFYIPKPPNTVQKTLYRLRTVKNRYIAHLEAQRRKKELQALKRELRRDKDYTIVKEFPRMVCVYHKPTDCEIDLSSRQSLKEWREYLTKRENRPLPLMATVVVGEGL